MSNRTAHGLLGEPYALYLAFAGLALGTVLLPQAPRLALLWTTLLLLAALHAGVVGIDLRFGLAEVGRGALLGLVISLPLLAVVWRPLRGFNENLYQTQDVVALYYQVCLVAAPAEELFFRGVVQARRGASAGAGLYALTGLLYFVPHAPFVAALLVFVAMALLGLVYAYVCEHHGLAASLACHVMVGLVLQVFPSLLATGRALLS